MILDNQAMYATAQAVTAVGDTASTNVYDHGPGNAGPGAGDMWLFGKTNAAFTTGAGGTLQAVLQDSADNSTFADVQTLTPVLAVAALPANRIIFQVRLPGNLRRYSRIAWRVGTGVMTAGTVTAGAVEDVDIQQYLASGFRVGT
jgi:hypothetical protein